MPCVLDCGGVGGTTWSKNPSFSSNIRKKPSCSKPRGSRSTHPASARRTTRQNSPASSHAPCKLREQRSTTPSAADLQERLGGRCQTTFRSSKYSFPSSLSAPGNYRPPRSDTDGSTAANYLRSCLCTRFPSSPKNPQRPVRRQHLDRPSTRFQLSPAAPGKSTTHNQLPRCRSLGPLRSHHFPPTPSTCDSDSGPSVPAAISGTHRSVPK